VLVPGELEHRREQDKTTAGVPLDRAVHDELAGLAERLGIPFALPECT
jgi:LDH2 family malate/lactate/ureidoglycolate dehydrogenase